MTDTVAPHIPTVAVRRLTTAALIAVVVYAAFSRR